MVRFGHVHQSRLQYQSGMATGLTPQFFTKPPHRPMDDHRGDRIDSSLPYLKLGHKQTPISAHHRRPSLRFDRVKAYLRLWLVADDLSGLSYCLPLDPDAAREMEHNILGSTDCFVRLESRHNRLYLVSQQPFWPLPIGLWFIRGNCRIFVFDLSHFTNHVVWCTSKCS